MAKKQIVKKVSKASKNRPIGVAILAVLSWITAVFTLIGGLLMIFGSSVVSIIINNVAPQYINWAGVGSILLIFFGIIFLLLSLIDYLLGKALWNGKNWARIVMLVLSALGIITSIVPFDLVNIVIGGLIIWYLGFNKTAIAYFK